MAKERPDSENNSEDDGDKSAKLSIVKKIAGPIISIFKRMFVSKKAIIISAACLVLVIAALAAVWFFFLRSDPKEVQEQAAREKELAAIEAQEKEIVFKDIVELALFERIPLKTGSAMPLVTIKVALELTDQRYRKQIFTMEERLRRIVESQVKEMTWLELRNPEGKLILKYDLIKRINSLFPQVIVRNVYFTYLIMQ